MIVLICANGNNFRQIRINELYKFCNTMQRILNGMHFVFLYFYQRVMSSFLAIRIQGRLGCQNFDFYRKFDSKV